MSPSHLKASSAFVVAAVLLVTACQGTPVPTTTPSTPTPSVVETPSVPATPPSTPESGDDASRPSLDELIGATRDADWNARWNAVNALGELADPRAIPALAERALRDDNPHPRWRSLWALAATERDGKTAKPLLLAGLQDADPTVVRNSAIALAFFGYPEGRPELLRGLNDPDSYRRWEAVFSLKEVPDPDVVAALIAKLDARAEQAEEVRAEAALGLGGIGGKPVIPDLLNVLNNDPSPAVRMRAVLALSRIGEPSVLGDLEQTLLTEEDTQVREFLKDAIAGLQGRR